MNFKSKLAQIGAVKIFIILAICLMSITMAWALLPEGIKYSDAYTISEHTEYGLIENTIYINITDNVDKDNYLNISHLYNNNYLTDQINYRDFKILADVQKDVYGLDNVSLGKYKTSETICNDTNETEICIDVYYNDLGNQMFCDYVLGDKSCLVENNIIIGTETVSKFINMPVQKEKVNIDGLKIEQKQNGVPIAKSSTIQLKLTYKKPLAIESNKPTEIQNKYDIEVCSVDGQYCSILDPTWWNSSWDYYKEYTNLTGNITYMEINKTGNDNADFNDTRFISCYNDSLIFNHTLEAKIGTYAQMRVNNLGENCTKRYYGNSEATSTSSASDVYFEPVSAYYLDANANDFVGSNDGTVSGATLTTGVINGSYDFDGSNDYVNLNDDFSDTGDKTYSAWIYQHSRGSSYLKSILMNIQDAGEGISLCLNGPSDGLLGGGANNVFGAVNGGNTILVHSTATISLNTWTHIGMVYDSSANTIKLYKNGSLDSTHTSITAPTVSGNNMILGADPRSLPSGNYNWDGLIDEVLIYDKALTPTQINQLYTQTAPNFIEGAEQSEDTCTCPGLASNWEIDLSDYCNITTNCNISIGNITFINNGSVLFNATLTANKISWKDSVTVVEKYNLGSNFRGRIG